MNRDPSQKPMFLESGGPIVFPDPESSDFQGLLAVGGDLSVARLLFAYEHGIFPWYDEGYPPFWWSPDPRCIFTPERLHVSRRLERRLRKGDYELSWNRAFRDVVRNCGRDRPEGTWIFDEMVDAYGALHDEGHAHSLEVWRERAMVGGIYGVQRGGLFAAESMFHTATDMSKVALVTCVRDVFAAGIELFDVQFQTPHLASMGAFEIDRREYLTRVREVARKPVSLAGLLPQ